MEEVGSRLSVSKSVSQSIKVVRDEQIILGYLFLIPEHQSAAEAMQQLKSLSTKDCIVCK